MNRRKLMNSLFYGIVVLGLASCTKDDINPGPATNPGGNGKFVILTAETGSGAAGYYAAYEDLPSGTVDNIGGFSLQARNYGGFTHYGNWIFNRATLAGESGVVQYSLSNTGKIEQTGFIKCGSSAKSLVVDATTGFYCDPDRGKTKIQKFNPTTMQRTGEIDLSPVIEKGDNISTNVWAGVQTIAAKEGKLYVSLTYSREKGSGHNDNTRKYSMAVVDIASGKPEKSIVHKFVKNQGFVPSEYPGFVQAKDGSLYFITTGWDSNTQNIIEPQPSGVFRIKAGQTDFDNDWYLSGKDLGLTDKSQMWSLKELNGTLYVDLSEEPLDLPSYSNLTKNMYSVYAVNSQDKKATKITGYPLTTFGYSTGNLEVVENDVFIRVVNPASKYNGYYKINADGKTASPAFNVIKGGQVNGLAKLTGKK
ncbi:DUF4374 domain-containing protein [Sphingobacterium lactis]|uniref:DUF4374 domain-containing protein n=1 Tax=Sphingobacterium lactis TaxID=797291 RepID=A0A1H5YZT5_9SPHI|nr:DUF4374 domain-containing protein [Sphingobacterium lactis]SEG28937.1 protein of unknown function [Sphingobacterium lactis]